MERSRLLVTDAAELPPRQATGSLIMTLGRINQMHPKLKGTWVSDKATTLKRWRWPRSLSKYRKAKFAKIFGRLKITFTDRYVICDFDGEVTKWKFQVIASDESSVVLRRIDTATTLKNVPSIMRDYHKAHFLMHIFFDGDKYWVRAGGSWNQEWFSRADEN